MKIKAHKNGFGRWIKAILPKPYNIKRDDIFVGAIFLL